MDSLIKSAKEIEALRAQVAALTQERDALEAECAAHPEPAPQEPNGFTPPVDRQSKSVLTESDSDSLVGAAPRYPWHPTEDDYRKATPLPDDVKALVEELRKATPEWLPQALYDQAADLIERLARQVPEGCVVAKSENIIACRDALLAKDLDEAYHQLYWSVDWRDPYNPWTGTRRGAGDVGSDTFGHLILPPGEPLYATTEAAPLATVEARYKDLLQRLGVQGHDGAVAEIGKLREAHGLEG